MSTLKGAKDPRTRSVDSKAESSSSGGEDQTQRGEIKVTTMISQFGSGPPQDQDDNSSVQNLVPK